MGRIAATSPLGASRYETREPARPETARDPNPPGRALVALDGGRRAERSASGYAPLGRPEAGFLAQLIVSEDQTLRPSRLERTRTATARYAETARRFG